MNLKEHLLSKNLISDNDWQSFIQNSSDHSKEAFIDFLLVSGLIEKQELLCQLSEMYNLPHIDLSVIEPKNDILTIIPHRICRQLQIYPFEYRYDSQELKVVCLKPLTDSEKQLIIDSTAVNSIDCYITYRSNFLLYEMDYFSSKDGENKSEIISTFQDQKIINDEICPGVIVLSPDKKYDFSFWNEISKQQYDVYIFDNIKDSIELIEKRAISKLFIQSNDKSRFAALEERFKYKNSSGTIIYYLQERNLLFSKTDEQLPLDILKDNFGFLKKIIVGENDYKSKHLDDLIPLVEQLCDRLCLPQGQVVATVGAAYLHDITFFVMDHIKQNSKPEDVCRLSAEYLKSFNHSKEIHETIQLMYREVSPEHVHQELYLAANIITAADHYCHGKYNQKKISVELFKKFKTELESKSGKQFLPLVTQAMIDIIYQRVYISKSDNDSCSVLVYNNSSEDKLMLKTCLENLGFEVIKSGQISEFANRYHKIDPDILILEVFQNEEHTTKLLETFRENGVHFENLPVYILSHKQLSLDSSALLQEGIEDIFYVPHQIDPFLIKIIRTKKRIVELSKQNMKILSGKGTFGSLADMNLIDLLQTMNGSGKTFVISITACAQQLTIYVDNGIIMGAESDDTEGVDAIYSGLTWNEGVWNIDPILLEEIPDPNINRSINSVLLEGCQHLDESGKIETTASVDNLNFPE